MEDGVWRTVGGRRIFIREGEDLSSAMKKSGKFKSKKTKIKDDSESNLPEKRDIKEDYEFEDKKAEDNYKAQLEKAREENRTRDKQDRVNYQKNQIEEASGLKVEKAFETDAFGTGKEDRFQLSDGRYIAHSTESMGKKEDSWSINKVEGGDIKSQEFKSYDDMIKHLSGDKSESGSSSSNSNQYTEYYKREHLGEPSNYQKGDKIEFRDGYYSTIKGTIVREATDNEKKHQINSNLKGYIVRDQNGNEHVVADTRIKNVGEHDTAYKKAYQEYKKKHPNTKLSFGQFVDASEGK